MGNEISSGEDAWATANCDYLVVSVISVTRPDMLLLGGCGGAADLSHSPQINGAFMMSVYVLEDTRFCIKHERRRVGVQSLGGTDAK